MHNPSPIYIVLFAVGVVQGYVTAAIVPISLAALFIRSRRRVLVASVSTLSWIVVVTGAVIGLAYLAEILIAWTRDNAYERFATSQRYTGAAAWFAWIELFGSVIAPQLFWFRRVRTNACLALANSAAILVPANLERLIMYITTHSEYLPESWR